MLVFFLLWVLIEYRHLRTQLEHERQSYIAEKKAWLQYVVDTNVDYIYDEFIKSDAIVRAEVKARVLEGSAIAGNLIATHGGRLSRNQLETLVREALRPIRFFSGRGYFFAINVDGTEELYADKPELEGKNLSHMVDDEGRRVIPEMIALAQAEGEGFYGYNWTKPGSDRNDHPKIAFLKLLPELGWVLGSGEYLEDVEADQRAKALDYLAARTIEKDGYIFGGAWDGMSLLGPMRGQNMLQTQDVNGLYIVKELIRRAREGGGFVEYVVPPFPDVQPLPKISYSVGIPE